MCRGTGMTYFNRMNVAALTCAALMLFSGPLQAQSTTPSVELSIPGNDNVLLIGGGLPFGLYFPLAGSICRLLETGVSAQRCAVVSLPDSAEAINALRNGEVPFALVQSDWLYHAVNGTSRYQETGPVENLRSVTGFYAEAFTVFVKATGPITSLSGLDGRRVSLGGADSYRGILGTAALDAAGLDTGDLAEVTAEPVVGAIERLCEGQTDAVVVMAAHPAELLEEAGRRCGITPLSFTDAQVADLMDQLPGYTEVVIPARTYPGQTVPIRTVGLIPVLVTLAGTDEGTVAGLTRAITQGLSRLNAAHPAFSTIGIDSLQSGGQFAQPHGAVQSVLGTARQ